MLYRSADIKDPTTTKTACPDIVKGPGLSIIRAASANQNVANINPHEKLEERSPYLDLTLKHSNRVNDWLVS